MLSYLFLRQIEQLARSGRTPKRRATAWSNPIRSGTALFSLLVSEFFDDSLYQRKMPRSRYM